LRGIYFGVVVCDDFWLDFIFQDDWNFLT